MPSLLNILLVMQTNPGETWERLHKGLSTEGGIVKIHFGGKLPYVVHKAKTERCPNYP